MGEDRPQWIASTSAEEHSPPASCSLNGRILARIWEDLGADLGGSWRGSGRILARIWVGYGRILGGIWEDLGRVKAYSGRCKFVIKSKKNDIYDNFFVSNYCVYQKFFVPLQRIFKTLTSMENLEVKECEELIINFAKEKRMFPDQMMSSFQTALLNIAGWVCECYQYTNDEYEAFMKEYAANVVAAVERRFRKE